MIVTAEYPKVEQPEPQTLSASDIELTTADTRPLTSDMASVAPLTSEPQPQSAASSTTDDAKMETEVNEAASQPPRTAMNDELLDLGDLQQPSFSSTEDFVLDIDLDSVPEAPPVDRYPAYVGRADLRTTVGDLRTASFPPQSHPQKNLPFRSHQSGALINLPKLRSLNENCLSLRPSRCRRPLFQAQSLRQLHLQA
jgi:hypothetical protein